MLDYNARINCTPGVLEIKSKLGSDGHSPVTGAVAGSTCQEEVEHVCQSDANTQDFRRNFQMCFDTSVSASAHEALEVVQDSGHVPICGLTCSWSLIW